MRILACLILLLLVHQAFFPGVNATNADLPDVFGIQGRNEAGQFHELTRAVTAQAGHRHTVQVAAWRQGGSVEIGVRVEPQDAQLLALVPAMAGHGTDRTDSQRMVAAQ